MTTLTENQRAWLQDALTGLNQAWEDLHSAIEEGGLPPEITDNDPILGVLLTNLVKALYHYEIYP